MRLPLNKNPTSAFMEFGQSIKQQPVLELVGQSGPSHKPKFTFVARIGQRAFPPVVTHNKKEGRREAAQAALHILNTEGAFQFSSGLSSNSQPVLTKSLVHLMGKKPKKVVNQGLKKIEKNDSVRKVEFQPPEHWSILPNGLGVESSQNGQHSSAGDTKGSRGRGQHQAMILLKKNPISEFMKFGQSIRQKPVLEMVGLSGPSHKPNFIYVAHIGGRAFPPVVTHNKKDGRREAAQVAIHILASEGAFQFSSGLSSKSQAVLTKSIVQLKGKKTKKVVNQSLNEIEKNDSVRKVEYQPPELSIMPNGLGVENTQNGQQPSAGDTRVRGGKGQSVKLQNKNPTSEFVEFGQSIQQKPVLELVEQSGPSHKPKFTFIARIGQRAFPPVVTHNKKEGRREAAEAALCILAAEGAFQFSSGLSSNSKAVLAKSLVRKKVVNQGLNTIEKNVSVRKVEFQPSEHWSILPNGLGVENSQNGQYSTADNSTGKRGNGLYQTMRMLNENPISAFMNFGQSIHQKPVLELVRLSGPFDKSKFTFVARIGQRAFPPVVTDNKKEGRREAAEAALCILAAEGAFQISSGLSSNSQPGFGATNFYDHIASLSHQAFNNLVVDIPECFSGKKVISALILKMDQSDGGRVIALGTGNRCVTGDKLSLEGQTVQDSHAEVITRRAFMRYLYRQLKMYRTNPEKTILCASPSGKLALKEGCSLHLYISTAPCGDGAQFSWTDNQGNQEGPSEDLNFSGHANHCPTIEKNIQGLLRTKMELGEGTIPIQEKIPVQTWDAIMQNQQRLRTMSCSDKVCRWNILGLQGSLLTHFVEPIYLSSLTLGTLYHHGHLSRAVCCRMTHCQKSLEEGAEGLPLGYRINHPQLGHVTSPEPPRGTEKTKEFSVNWYAGCDNAEVTDGTVGRIKGVVPSRLCKMNLLKEFIEACTLYNSPILQRDLDSYNNIKLTAEDFQKAKAFMKNLFRKGKYGTWVEKPVEVDMFPP